MRLRCASSWLALAALVVIAGCSESSSNGPRTTQGNGGGSTTTTGGGGSGGGTGGSGVGGTIGGLDPGKEAGPVEASACFTCKPAVGQYCGAIGEGCTRKTLQCGMVCDVPGYTCKGGGVDNLCGAQPDSGVCELTVCDKGPAGKYCGKVDNGCGTEMDCGGCPAGFDCGGAGTPNVCGVMPDAGTCTTNCNPPGGTYCGDVGNGCGGTLRCPTTCPGTFTCGGAGANGVCGAPFDSGMCPTQTVCDQGISGKLCGSVGDGCGGQMDCGGCPAGWSCGAAGQPGVCGATPPTCTLNVCNPPGGLLCGDVGDGCGGKLSCNPTCPAPQTCGVRQSGVCGTPCPLCNQVPTCSEASVTTISGKVVTARATGADPVPRASVYIPNIALGAKLGPIMPGATCDRCQPLTQDVALASAISNADGTFVIQGNIPAGTGIPLVVQLGKWRYETTIDVQPCTNNALPDGVARLPRTQSEGNIPLTALSTGNVDSLECILRKIGVADTEFGNPGGAGRIHFYKNNGANYDTATPNQAALVGTPAVMEGYDQILFPCEGSQTNETAAALTNFTSYTSKGGRAFATHFSYTWLYMNGGFATAGTWAPSNNNPTSPLIANIDLMQPKGQDFATWLGIVGALSNAMPPQVSIADPRRNLNAIPANQGGVRWIYADTSPPPLVQHATFDTPIIVPPDPDRVCGRVIYSDFHVANSNNNGLTFPAECPSADLTPQEKILEYMLFDLASCIGDPPPTKPPPPPP
ncbi:MAG TPA: hypothetical protein VK550_11565, partial [Polyangiaceae bacterium]|nr:hypothetical protein [Polyangiaceae bacterium]